MDIVIGSTVVAEFTVRNANLELQDADTLPTGALRVNGSSDETVVTVTKIAIGHYQATFTAPGGWTVNHYVILTVTATVDGLTDKQPIASGVVRAVVPVANATQLGGDSQSLLDLKDFADTGYDPSTHSVGMVQGVAEVYEFAPESIQIGTFADGAITEAAIADSAITWGKIADNAISAAKIANGTISVDKIANGAITSDKAPNLDAAISTRAAPDDIPLPSDNAAAVAAQEDIAAALTTIETNLDAKVSEVEGGGGGGVLVNVDNTEVVQSRVVKLGSRADGVTICYPPIRPRKGETLPWWIDTRDIAGGRWLSSASYVSTSDAEAADVVKDGGNPRVGVNQHYAVVWINPIWSGDDHDKAEIKLTLTPQGGQAIKAVMVVERPKDDVE